MADAIVKRGFTTLRTGDYKNQNRFHGGIAIQGRTKTLPMRFKIEGALSKATDAEWSDALQYTFKINPFNIDRVFTMMMYTQTSKRDTAKHSDERNAIARLLKQRHRDVWRRYKEALEVPE